MSQDREPFFHCYDLGNVHVLSKWVHITLIYFGHRVTMLNLYVSWNFYIQQENARVCLWVPGYLLDVRGCFYLLLCLNSNPDLWYWKYPPCYFLFIADRLSCVSLFCLLWYGYCLFRPNPLDNCRPLNVCWMNETMKMIKDNFLGQIAAPPPISRWLDTIYK